LTVWLPSALSSSKLTINFVDPRIGWFEIYSRAAYTSALSGMRTATADLDINSDTF
jgi:hypothetical protein